MADPFSFDLSPVQLPRATLGNVDNEAAQMASFFRQQLLLEKQLREQQEKQLKAENEVKLSANFGTKVTNFDKHIEGLLGQADQRAKATRGTGLNDQEKALIIKSEYTALGKDLRTNKLNRQYTSDYSTILVDDVIKRYKTPKEQEERGFFGTIVQKAKEGLDIAGAGVATQTNVGIGSELADLAKYKPTAQEKKVLDTEIKPAFDRFDKDPSLGAGLSAAWALASNPKFAIGEVSKSLASSLGFGLAATLGGAKAGGAIGSLAGPAGAAIGATAGGLAGYVGGNIEANIASEAAGKMIELIRERGPNVDLSKPEQIDKFLAENPTLRDEALAYATKKGAVTGATEAGIELLTAGGGRVLKAVKGAKSASKGIEAGIEEAAKATTSKAVGAAKVAGALTAQGVGEAAGSAAGSYSVGEEINKGDLLMEGLLGAGSGVADIGLLKSAMGGQPAPIQQEPMQEPAPQQTMMPTPETSEGRARFRQAAAEGIVPPDIAQWAQENGVDPQAAMQTALQQVGEAQTQKGDLQTAGTGNAKTLNTYKSLDIPTLANSIKLGQNGGPDLTGPELEQAIVESLSVIQSAKDLDGQMIYYDHPAAMEKLKSAVAFLNQVKTVAGDQKFKAAQQVFKQAQQSQQDAVKGTVASRAAGAAPTETLPSGGLGTDARIQQATDQIQAAATAPAPDQVQQVLEQAAAQGQARSGAPQVSEEVNQILAQAASQAPQTPDQILEAAAQQAPEQQGIIIADEYRARAEQAIQALDEVAPEVTTALMEAADADNDRNDTQFTELTNEADNIIRSIEEVAGEPGGDQDTGGVTQESGPTETEAVVEPTQGEVNAVQTEGQEAPQEVTPVVEPAPAATDVVEPETKTAGDGQEATTEIAEAEVTPEVKKLQMAVQKEFDELQSVALNISKIWFKSVGRISPNPFIAEYPSGKKENFSPKTLTDAQFNEVQKMIDDLSDMNFPVMLMRNLQSFGTIDNVKFSAAITDDGDMLLTKGFFEGSKNEKLSTIVHEFAHTIDDVSGTDAWNNAHEELKNWADRDENTILWYPFKSNQDVDYRKESFAQAMALYFTNFDLLRENAPSTVDVIAKIVSEKRREHYAELDGGNGATDDAGGQQTNAARREGEVSPDSGGNAGTDGGSIGITPSQDNVSARQEKELAQQEQDFADLASRIVGSNLIIKCNL